MACNDEMVFHNFEEVAAYICIIVEKSKRKMEMHI